LAAALVRFPAFAAVPDSDTLSAPVVLHGKLGEFAGAPMGGAQVLLSAWPSNEYVTQLPIGETFSTVPIARGSAASDGSYELRSALTPMLAGLVSKDGLDVQFDVFAGGRQYRYLVQIRPLDGDWVRQTVTDTLTKTVGSGANAANLLNVVLDGRTAKIVADEDVPDLQHPSDPYCEGNYTKIAQQAVPTTVATAVARPAPPRRSPTPRGPRPRPATGSRWAAAFSASVEIAHALRTSPRPGCPTMPAPARR
jgi:hypothetical protein